MRLFFIFMLKLINEEMPNGGVILKIKIKSISFFIILTMILSLTAGCGSKKAENSNLQISEKIDEYVKTAVKEKDFSGTILVSKNNETILKKGYGKSNIELGVNNLPDSEYCIGQITEEFTAAAILKLQEMGELNISDPISKYVPKYLNGDKIHISDLLSHTSGIIDFTQLSDYDNIMSYDYSVQRTIDSFKNKNLKFEPGTSFNSSTSDYYLLGYIIEKVSNQSYNDFLKKYIFKPLKMNNTSCYDAGDIIKNRAQSYKNNKDGKVSNVEDYYVLRQYSSGGIYSNVSDIYTWLKSFDSGKIVNKDSLSKLLSDSSQGPYNCGFNKDSLLGKKRYFQNGSNNGYSSTITKFYKDNTYIIILANKQLSNEDLNEMTSNISLLIFK